MELLIAWSHLLDKIVTYGIPARNLWGSLGLIWVEVLNDRLFAWLVIDDCGADLSLKSHSHGHRSGFSLFLVFSIKSFTFDQIFVLVWGVHYDYSHGIFEFLWVFKFNQKATLAKLVFGFLSGLSELLRKLLKLILSLDGLGTLFSDLVCRSWSLNFKVDFRLLHVFVLDHGLQTLLNTLISDRFGVLVPLLLGLEHEVDLAFLADSVILFFFILLFFYFCLGLLDSSWFGRLWCWRSWWSSSLLGLLGKSCDRGGSFGFCGLLRGGLSLGLLGLGVLVSLLLIILVIGGFGLLRLFWRSLLFLVGLLILLLLYLSWLRFDLGSTSFALFGFLRDLSLNLGHFFFCIILGLLLDSLFLLLLLRLFLNLGRWCWFFRLGKRWLFGIFCSTSEKPVNINDILEESPFGLVL